MPTAKVDPRKVEKHKQRMTELLRQAGPRGVIKTGLKAQSVPAQAALGELIHEGIAANLGTAKSHFYVLSEIPALEVAYLHVQKKLAGSKTRELFTKRELETGAGGKVRQSVVQALELMQKEGELIRFKRGKTSYYAPGRLVRERLNIPDRPGDEPSARAVSRRRVLEAYHGLVKKTGFIDVRIGELQPETGLPMDELKQFIIDERRAGRAVLAQGDWSISSERTRAGAIEIDALPGRRYLLVRFEDEEAA